MRTNFVVAFLTALCLAVVGGSADLVAQRGGKNKKGDGKAQIEPIHFVFRNAGSDNIIGVLSQDPLMPELVYRDQVDGGDAVIADPGHFRWRPSANLKGQDAKNAEDKSHKMFFRFDRVLVSAFDQGALPSPCDIGTCTILAALQSQSGHNAALSEPSRLCSELVTLPAINDCVPEGALRALKPGQAYLSGFLVRLVSLNESPKGPRLRLSFKTDSFANTDYVRVTCITNRTNADTPPGTTCTKWRIEAVDDTGGDGGPDNLIAVAKLRDLATDTVIGHFSMPFRIIACLDASNESPECPDEEPPTTE